MCAWRSRTVEEITKQSRAKMAADIEGRRIRCLNLKAQNPEIETCLPLPNETMAEIEWEDKNCDEFMLPRQECERRHAWWSHQRRLYPEIFSPRLHPTKFHTWIPADRTLARDIQRRYFTRGSCQHLRDEFKIEPCKSWGNASPVQRQRWKDWGCNWHYPSECAIRNTQTVSSPSPIQTVSSPSPILLLPARLR